MRVTLHESSGCDFQKIYSDEAPVEIAVAEGEDDLSLGYWRKVHADLYQPHLESWGLKTIRNATVITEFFELVYK